MSTAMRRLSVTLSPGLALLVCALVLSESPAGPKDIPFPPCKPTPPIQIDAKIVGDPAGPFGIAARASSPIDAEIELEAVLPDGVTLLGGDRTCRAKRPEIKIECSARDRVRREIWVRASFEKDGARATRVVPLVLHDAPQPRPGTLKRDARGEAILEFDR